MRRSERNGLRAWRIAGFTAAALGILSVPAAGQTRFAWPDTAVDVSRYTTIEECQAATNRVEQSVASHEQITRGVWLDTMPPDPRERLSPPAAPVGETVRRCLGRFATAESVPVSYFRTLVPLYLIAGWDDKALALIQRRMAAVPSGAQSELAAVIDSVSWMYEQVRPPRLAQAEELVAKYAPRVTDRTKRLRIYLTLMMLTGSEWRTDTVRAARVIRRAVAIADSLTDQERSTLKDAKLAALDLGIDEVGNLEEQLYALLNESVGKATFLDSLRRSTAAFVALKRENWRRATRRPATAFEVPIGQRASAIQADFWLGRGSATAPPPTPGRVSLVTFINWSASESYTDNLVPLRRLAARFPQLEITVVAQSHGHFMTLKDSITPAKEAELTKRWLESFGVQAALAMTSTDYWRLPGPDRRRIDRAVANRTNYSFGRSWATTPEGATFLVDAEGIVVHAGVGIMTRTEEDEVVELIEVLLARGKS